MPVFTLYKAINQINNKIYIGFDSKWPRRKAQHIRESLNYKNRESYNYKFHNAIRKYGKNSFVWEIIAQNQDKDYVLHTLEPLYIAVYESFGTKGYNMTFGGEGVSGSRPNFIPWMKGKHHTEETKQKIKEARKHQIITIEARKKMSEKRKGFVQSEETKKRISLSNKGKLKGRIPWNKKAVKTNE